MQVNISETSFLFLGLTQDPGRRNIVIAIFLFFYTGTLVGNLLIFATIKTSQALGSPMYFFLSYLSLSDTCFSTILAPRKIVDFLMKEAAVSFSECIIQVFTFHLFGSLEIFILILMVVDRYAAICKPFHYMTIMNRRVCGMLVATVCVGSFMHSLFMIFLALTLPFCGPYVTDHYFCNLQPLLKLACADTYVINLLLVVNSGTLCTVSFLMLMISYVIILYSLRNHSAEAWKKAHSLVSCVSHIIVVVLFFVPCIYIYNNPGTTFTMDKMILVFYTIFTPFLNPLIYTLKNAEVKMKNAMRNLWSKIVSGDI
ncbi:LOW QUALITY PROTEIN: olfactory receptor 4C11-like isoform X2 [Cricetulus griseus]|uniref:LOW QUALITY PROTEIN: olfactory receptor 4C11-like isoform X2 n=1 Tax=Cricetulus griseus TaxID=10029 RepID=A0A9J7G5G9_CRIGR|nr:LOW QUALITY PROTEIN: olfactory receptor 4C11-like isoform X2 [Cricetulus griseus]